MPAHHTPRDDLGAARRRTAPSWLVAGALLVAAFSVYAVTATRSQVSLDVWSANYASWHLVETGSPWLDGVSVPELGDSPVRAVWLQQSAAGHPVIVRSPGVVAVGLPAYAALAGRPMSLGPGALTAALVTGLSVLLMYLALSRSRLSQGRALAATCAFAFATPVWSVAANGVWPHTVTVLGIAGMAWASASGRWWLAGVFGGVTLWGRLHATVVVAVLGLVLGVRRRRLDLTTKVALPSAVGLALLCAWSRWMYGSWSPTSSYGGGAFSQASAHRFDLVNQAGMWVAPDRGVLVWTPVLLLLLPALVRSWRGLPDWTRALFWGGLGYTVLQAALITFTGGDVVYGYRVGLEFLACATPAFALASPRVGRIAHALLVPVLALQAYAIALGSVVDTIFLPESRAWHDNAFVDAMGTTWPVGPLVGVVVVAAATVLARRLTPGPLPVSPEGSALPRDRAAAGQRDH